MHTCSRLLVAILVIAAPSVLISAPDAIAATTTHTTCSPTQVTLTSTPEYSNYASGALVHITVALHNHSANACTFATGPFSPNFTLTNPAGVTVWGSCWFGGGPAPCADYLLQRTLAPGSTFRDRLTWDPRTGHPEVAVPAGRYTFDVHFPDLTLHAHTSIVLTRPGNATIALADSGRHYVVAVSDVVTVRLFAPPFVWTTAISSDLRVLVSLPEVNTVAGLFAFRSLAPGTARISAVGNPVCSPQCLMPSRIFFVTVTVRAS